MNQATKRILVIDDEPDLARAVRLTITLQEPDWAVDVAHSGREGLKKLLEGDYDLVLLDLVMPDMSGFDVLKQIRAFNDVPVIILTVRDDELDKVHGLELGADDYIVKPFGHLELMARIRSVFRRVEGTVVAYQKPYRAGDLKVDFNERAVYLKGERLGLTATEYHLLEILVKNAGRVVSRERLLSWVWGEEAVDHPDYLKVYIHRLRNKLGDPRWIQTVRGMGYRFVPLSESGEAAS